MKLSLNREYAVRHLGVAALMAALCAWFVYDGAVAYPAMSDVDFKEKVLHNLDYPDFPKKRKETTDRQFQFAAIAGLARRRPLPLGEEGNPSRPRQGRTQGDARRLAPRRRQGARGEASARSGGDMTSAALTILPNGARSAYLRCQVVYITPRQFGVSRQRRFQS